MMKKGIVRLKIERIIKVLLLKMRGKDDTENGDKVFKGNHIDVDFHWQEQLTFTT